MTRDVKLFQRPSSLFDIDFENGDIALTDGLDTALYMSVFCEQRALSTEVSDPLQRRGHFTNDFSDIDGYEVGSKFWLYTARATNTERNAELLQKTVREDGLQWMIDDAIVKDVAIDITRVSDKVTLDIKLTTIQDDTLYYQTFLNTFI
jgi:phage gp46-like protein